MSGTGLLVSQSNAMNVRCLPRYYVSEVDSSTGILIILPRKLNCLPEPNVRTDMNCMRGHIIHSTKNDKSCMGDGMSFKVAGENLGHLAEGMHRWQATHKVLHVEIVRPNGQAFAMMCAVCLFNFVGIAECSRHYTGEWVRPY